MSNDYSIALADFPDGLVNEATLHSEINANANIVPHCSAVGMLGSDVVVSFLGALSAGEQTELEDVVVPAHDNTPTPADTIPVAIENEDGSQVSFPMTDGENGKTPIFQPNIIPAGYFFWGTGAFDDVAGNKVGEGDQIAWTCTVSVTPPNDEVLVGRFMHHVYVLGGHVAAKNADVSDWVTLEIRAPASSPEDRTGTNDGNANKVATGLGFNVLVPAPLGDGDWNVDGSDMEAGEINQDLCPVPNTTGTGFWNWDPNASPSITPVANPLAPDGSYDLYDVQLPLARQANRYPLMIEGNVTPVASIKGKKILPHWEWVFTLRRGVIGTATVAIRLDTARKKTL